MQKYYLKNLITGNIIFLGTNRLTASLTAKKWGNNWQLVS